MRPRGFGSASGGSRDAIRWDVTASIPCRARDDLMERRVFIAIGLSFLVLYMYQAYFAPPPPVQTGRPAASSSAAQTTTPPSASTKETEAPAPTPATAPPAAPQPDTVVGETSERTITVETSTVDAVFTNSGGRLLHWRLKNYRGNDGRIGRAHV